MASGRDTVQKHSGGAAHLYAFSLFRALSKKEGLIAISALHSQEAVGGVSYTRWQYLVTQHRIDH